MRKGTLLIGGLVLLLLILFMWWRSTYNKFVQLDENVKAQLGQLNNVYQQRADLIPNLVETVKGAAIQERGTLTDVISARSRATSMQLTPEALKDPQAFENFQKAQGELGGALSRLMVVVEKYPQLQSQGNFPVLMSQLEGQENRIRVERNRYNDVVNEYNRHVRTFPSSTIAGMSGFTQYPYFQAGAGTENAPKVDFGGQSQGAAPNSQAPAPGQAPASAPVQNAAPSPSATPHGAVRPSPAPAH
jgi:LemA protein